MFIDCCERVIVGQCRDVLATRWGQSTKGVCMRWEGEWDVMYEQQDYDPSSATFPELPTLSVCLLQNSPFMFFLQRHLSYCIL
jgi:hypothetical protein